MLAAPSYQELCWSTVVFLAQLYNDWVLHPQGSSERSVCLDDNVVLLAERGYVCSSVEWMYLIESADDKHCRGANYGRA